MRPWCAAAKVLQWKISDMFVKFSGKPECYYGQLYRAYKADEIAKDMKGLNAECARQTLLERNFSDADVRGVYESGHLPAGRIDLRARRRVSKLFLSHWHQVMWESTAGACPKPYILEHSNGQHTRHIPPPNWPMV